MKVIELKEYCESNNWGCNLCTNREECDRLRKKTGVDKSPVEIAKIVDVNEEI